MVDERVVLRDESGRVHTVTRGLDGAVTIGDVTLTVQVCPDGSVRVNGDRICRGWSVDRKSVV